MARVRRMQLDYSSCEDQQGPDPKSHSNWHPPSACAPHYRELTSPNVHLSWGKSSTDSAGMTRPSTLKGARRPMSTTPGRQKTQAVKTSCTRGKPRHAGDPPARVLGWSSAPGEQPLPRRPRLPCMLKSNIADLQLIERPKAILRAPGSRCGTHSTEVPAADTRLACGAGRRHRRPAHPGSTRHAARRLTGVTPQAPYAPPPPCPAGR